ncbi:MAG: tRNA (adenosine(37)-N6)-threonylcarbamoyltransferase complex dimerization subunit type 1 TsaB [Balneolaceae bacterium]|nr:MAG: tRNA (adenosine(37)-N6)-threonylcarbamoyltransferase complex dimerization subunit type 1 TsaB [Balneolaceae bacterium]
MDGNTDLENVLFTGKPVLSVETATPVCSVALRLPDGTVHELRAEGKGVHSEQTFVFIDRLLAREKLAVNDLGSVIVSAGPGSYTGLRVASSAVKGLLFQTDVPLYACRTLGAIALGAMLATLATPATPATQKTPATHAAGTTPSMRKSDAGRGADELSSGESRIPESRGAVHGDGPLHVAGCDAVIDARRNHLYHQSWKFLEDGLEPESDVQVRELEEILERWKSGRLVVGTGVERLKEIAPDIQGSSANISVLPLKDVVSASNILAVLGRYSGAQLQNLIKKVAPEHFEPYYYTGL